MLYFAAQQLRSLRTGEAYVHYAGLEGIAATHVLVPHVRAVVRTDAQYSAIRKAILERSSAALPLAEANAVIAAREQVLLAEAGTCSGQAEPDDFRVPQPSRQAITPPGAPASVLAQPGKGDRRRSGRRS